MRSPILAMLWETWRLTRSEVAWRFVLGIVGAWTVLSLFAAFGPNRFAVQDFGAAIALVVVVAPHIMGWFSLTMLTGGLPGFPLHLLYTRPIRTAVLVGVPMAYLTIVSAAIYLVSALVLRVTSGYAFPLLPVAAWIAALTVVYLAVNWSTRNPVFLMLAYMPAVAGWILLADHRLNAEEIQGSFDWPPRLWPTRFDFPLTDYVFIGAIALVSFRLVVARVARERRGDNQAVPLALDFGFPDQLISLFRFPCPISSATRAQLWFDLKSGGLPLVTIGVVLAILNPLVFAATGLIDALLPGAPAGTFAVMFAALSVMAVLFFWLNAFGIRWKQGRFYAGAFELTQACRTARLAGIKVLVRSVCLLAALVPVVVSIWASVRLLAPGKGSEFVRRLQRAVEGAIGALSGDQQVALAVLAAIGIAVLVASAAAIWVFAARYPGRLNIALGSWLLLHCLVLLLLGLNGYRGIGLFVEAARWVDAPLIVFATIYLTWRAFAERLLSLHSAAGIVLVSAGFATAWVVLLRAGGVQLTGISMMNTLGMLTPTLLPLMASVLAPWSLSRIRHT